MSNEQLFTTYQVVYEDLKDKILDKTFQPGEKLPSFSELCEIYNVSNITGVLSCCVKTAMSIPSRELVIL